MQPLKATFLAILMVLSSMAGCISGEESEKESEEKIEVTGENESVFSVELSMDDKLVLQLITNCCLM